MILGVTRVLIQHTMRIFYQLRKKKCSRNLKLNIEDLRSFLAKKTLKNGKKKINKRSTNFYAREQQKFWKIIKCVKSNFNKK